MIINGTITNAGPASPPTGQHGVMYQDVVIRDNNGYEYTGRIGSKNGYAVNTPIQVTMEEKSGHNGPYNYFKKYNPQYLQGQQDSQSQQRPPQQQAPQQQAPQGPTAKDVLIVRQCCIKAAARLNVNEPQEAIFYARKFEDYCLGRDQRVGAAPPTQPSGANPDYDPNPAPIDDRSDIPF